MPKIIQIEEFIALLDSYPILDVRTPAEFERGNIPRANNLPLFSNDERKIIGTIYKQQGRQPAILKGLELVGPKMKELVEAATKISNSPPFFKEGAGPARTYPFDTGGGGQVTFLIHCWRGGMRSSSVAWLLELYGAKVYVLKGGYKSFRKFVLNTFQEQRKLLILGGRTGSGKTLVLKELGNVGEQILDLEKLANHKGSSFGSLGEEKQPTQEQFENELAMCFRKADREKPLWLEDESRMIGNKVIPGGLWLQMRSSKVIYLDIPFEERANYLTELYGKYSSEDLIAAIERIKKRLGPQHAKAAIEHIYLGELKKACEIILLYYDKTYHHATSKRAQGTIIKCNFENSDVNVVTNEIKKYSV